MVKVANGVKVKFEALQRLQANTVTVKVTMVAFFSHAAIDVPSVCACSLHGRQLNICVHATVYHAILQGYSIN